MNPASLSFLFLCFQVLLLKSQLFQEFARVGKPKSRLVILANTAHDPKSKQIVDELYLTKSHKPEEYYHMAEQNGWLLASYFDLTDMTYPYFVLREKSENATGIEEFVYSGFKNRTFQYHLFVYDLTK